MHNFHFIFKKTQVKETVKNLCF